MKKYLLSFVFAVATIITVQAQTPSIGIRAGVNYSGFAGEDADDLDRLFGFHGGITSQFALLSDNFLVIQPELLFSKKGAEFEDNSGKLKLNYLDVPVLARINAGPLYFEAGPQVSFRIGGEHEMDGTSNDDLDDIKRTSLGYAAGVGLAATPLGLSIGVRYNGDFSKLYDEDDFASIRNDLFMLTLSFMLTGK